MPKKAIKKKPSKFWYYVVLVLMIIGAGELMYAYSILDPIRLTVWVAIEVACALYLKNYHVRVAAYEKKRPAKKRK